MWSLLSTSLGLELVHGVETKDAGKDVLGELADDDVVFLNDFVEGVASLVDAVLSTFQLHLQVAEILVSFQFGIVLLNGNQFTQSRTQLTLCLLEFLQLLRCDV